MLGYVGSRSSQPATDLPDARRFARIVENPFDSFVTGIPGRFDRLVEILTIHEPADLSLLVSTLSLQNRWFVGCNL